LYLQRAERGKRHKRDRMLGGLFLMTTSPTHRSGNIIAKKIQGKGLLPGDKGKSKSLA
jgi:hypothetical protein